MVKNIVWERAPVTEIEDRSILNKLSEHFKRTSDQISSLHPSVKWTIALVLGAVISKIAEIALSTYFYYGFNTLEQVNQAFRIQFIMDFIIVILLLLIVSSIINLSRRV